MVDETSRTLPPILYSCRIEKLSAMLTGAGMVCALLGFGLAELLALNASETTIRACMRVAPLCRFLHLDDLGGTALTALVWLSLALFALPLCRLVLQGQVAGYWLDRREDPSVPHRL